MSETPNVTYIYWGFFYTYVQYVLYIVYLKIGAFLIALGVNFLFEKVKIAVNMKKMRGGV